VGTAPKAWAVVDADTGRFIASSGARVPLPPASLSKVLTALVVVETLRPDTPVPVSRRAAGTPASRIGMKTGQAWSTENALRAMLLVSANDAAVALAEKAGGARGMTGFQERLAGLAKRLGLADTPVLRDPSGLDDASSVDGGNRVSARDMAIVARAALAQPRIKAIVSMREYRFKDPGGVTHHLVNHNKLLVTYPGLIGVKTGFTRKAGGCLMTAARRNGRTMVAVVLGTGDIYGSSRVLLDFGFGTRVGDEPRDGALPKVPSAGAPARASSRAPSPKASSAGSGKTGAGTRPAAKASSSSSPKSSGATVTVRTRGRV
jgi:D-alanyl-D-alanine carboxypeptidase (penicillin-binding protein 5/6)